MWLDKEGIVCYNGYVGRNKMTHWLSRLWILLNNRIAEPIHAHIRKVLNVPSRSELQEQESRMAWAQSTFLQHVESAEAMLSRREQALNRKAYLIENKLQDLHRLEERIGRLHTEAESVASQVTVTASDAVVQLRQVIELLRDIKKGQKDLQKSNVKEEKEA